MPHRVRKDVVIGHGTEFCDDRPLGEGGHALISCRCQSLSEGKLEDIKDPRQPPVMSVTAGKNGTYGGIGQGIVGMRPGGTRTITVWSTPFGRPNPNPPDKAVYTVKLLYVDHDGDRTAVRTHDVKIGDGPGARDSDRATIRWKATLLDGSPTSLLRTRSAPSGGLDTKAFVSFGNPLRFDLANPQCALLRRAIIGMRVGGIRRVFFRQLPGLVYGMNSFTNGVVLELTLVGLDKPKH